MKSTVGIRYFAVLRDAAGKASEDIPLEAGQSAGQLFTMLAERYEFPLTQADVRFAVNDEFTSKDHILNGGDTLVFIPPVSGG